MPIERDRREVRRWQGQVGRGTPDDTLKTGRKEGTSVKYERASG